MGRPKKTADNWILAYYQGIKNGTYTVGKWITLVYEYLVHGLENKEFFFDQKRATDAIEWIESHCFHVEGPLAPNPIKLEVWQKAIISAIYGIRDAKGNRNFREIFLLVSRKNGKSALACCIANYEFRAYGKGDGAGGFGTRIYCVAPKLDQADIIYNNLWAQIQLDPEWKEQKEIINSERDEHNKRINDDSMLVKKRVTDLYIAGTNSTVKKLPFSAKRSDGFNPSVVLADECASWEGLNGIRQYEVMRSAMGARPDGIILACTTSGYVNDGIFDELLKRSTRFLMGDSKEKKLLPFLYMIDDVERWSDINELRKSNPNLGVSVPVDYLIEEIAIAEGSLSKAAEFKTKYACIKQNSSLAWMPSNVIERAYGEPLRLEDFADHYCVCGIDLSQTVDLTSVCAVIEKDGELYVFSKCFLPTERLEEAKQRDNVPYDIYLEKGFLQLSGDNYIDYNDCYKWLTDLIEQYQIYPLMVGFDRFSAQYLIQALRAYGFKCDDVFQGDNLYPNLLEIQGLMEDGKIHIGNNDLLKMHLYDSAIKMNVERGRGRLVKLTPKCHIDAVAALADAMCVRQKWFNEIGEQLRNVEG